MTRMLQSAMLMGATGLVGNAALTPLARHCQTLWLPGRRAPANAPANSVFIETDFADFSTLDQTVDAAPEVLCIAFGTTIRQAGSQSRFREVDFGYPLALAQWAVNKGTRHICLISAVGANAQSRVFYNRVKGELEEALQALPLSRLHILRPSLLLGPHGQRPMEAISQALLGPIAPLLPARVRPIKAGQLAQTLVACALSTDKAAGEAATAILEGKPLFSGFNRV
ncbi:MAG: NAD-dependent epimerase/dehydratase family protein [Saccharospirillum sp.]